MTHHTYYRLGGCTWQNRWRLWLLVFAPGSKALCAGKCMGLGLTELYRKLKRGQTPAKNKKCSTWGMKIISYGITLFLKKKQQKNKCDRRLPTLLINYPGLFWHFWSFTYPICKDIPFEANDLYLNALQKSDNAMKDNFHKSKQNYLMNCLLKSLAISSVSLPSLPCSPPFISRKIDIIKLLKPESLLSSDILSLHMHKDPILKPSIIHAQVLCSHYFS